MKVDCFKITSVAFASASTAEGSPTLLPGGNTSFTILRSTVVVVLIAAFYFGVEAEPASVICASPAFTSFAEGSISGLKPA
jgi:hypothetical protein